MRNRRGRDKEWSPPLNLKHRPKCAPPQSGVKKGLLEDTEQERGGFCFWEKIAGDGAGLGARGFYFGRKGRGRGVRGGGDWDWEGGRS